MDERTFIRRWVGGWVGGWVGRERRTGLDAVDEEVLGDKRKVLLDIGGVDGRGGWVGG